MDHLILPSGPLHPVLEVRLRDKEEYDGLDFTTYPERQGWGDRTDAEWLNVFKDPTPSFIAILERWLLFGPTMAAFGAFCKPCDFIHLVGDPVYPIFTSVRLPDLIRQLIDYIRTTESHPEDMALVAVLSGELHKVLVYSEAYSEASTTVEMKPSYEIQSLPVFLKRHSYAIKDPRDPAVIIATSTMIETIFSIASPEGDVTSLNYQGPIWTKMRQDGWCPSELSRLFNQFNTACLYFIYNLTRPSSHESHDLGFCTQLECSNRKLRENEYTTRHVEGCNTCDDVVADLEKLCRTIERGKIPLIRSIDENNGGSGIVLDEAESDVPYVAISHVWSDGLGNLQRNALPRCQLLRLSNMVRSLRGRHQVIRHFWLDTICIPPDLAGMHQVQSLAIGQMRNIYSDASNVLVLDSWLFNSQMKDKTHAEIVVKIFCSTWNTRLWTFQEGALAKSLYFQFSDGAYDLDRGITELCACKDPEIALTIIQPLLIRYHVLRGFRNQHTKEEMLIAIQVALKDRNTSVATDEPLCLAVLLDLNVTEIAKTESSSRMEKFWKMQETIPREVVFTSLATSNKDGFHWAPLTFLRSRLNVVAGTEMPTGEQLYSSSDSVTRTESGVVIECPGIRFICLGGLIGDHTFVIDERGSWLEVSFHHRLGDGLGARRNDPHNPSRVTLDPRVAFGCQEVAILPAWHGEDVDIKHGQKVIKGILVSFDREDEGIIYCRRMLHCTMIEEIEQGDNDRDLTAHFSYFGPVAIENDGTILCVGGKWTPASQRWCVG